MRKLLGLVSVCALILVLSACADDNLKKISGKWAVDGQATLQTMADEELAGNPFAAVLANTIFDAIKIEIDGTKKTFTANIVGETKTAEFTVTSSTAKKISLKMVGSGSTAEVEILEDGKIGLVSDGKKLILKRSQ